VKEANQFDWLILTREEMAVKNGTWNLTRKNGSEFGVKHPVAAIDVRKNPELSVRLMPSAYLRVAVFWCWRYKYIREERAAFFSGP
jgi:hypothetical protein